MSTGDLIILSNRVPPPDSSQGNQGGLAVGVLNALKKGQGIWVGWSGEVAEEGEPMPRSSNYFFGGVRFETYPLSRHDYDNYYSGFSNEVLWPLFHYRTDKMAYNREKRRSYIKINRLFAQRAAKRITPGASVWVHDYHLLLVASYLRPHAPKAPLGFFLHTPFPPWQVLQALPGYQEFLEALACYDLIGVHTSGDRDNLIGAFVKALGARVEGQRIHHRGRSVKIRAFPISIDVDEVAELARIGSELTPNRRLTESLGEKPLILGVDRLDYTKGIYQRFAAYQIALEKYPKDRCKVVYMQIAPPSRIDVNDYVDLRKGLEALAGHINGRFSEYDWTPLRYLNRGYPRDEVMAFMRMAGVGLVTPLRDGMNLVAKEFVAAQGEDDPGVLVLSQFAGAAEELQDGALICNPYDVEGLAQTLQRALLMPLKERQERWRKMMRTLRKYDIHRWGKDFISTLHGK